MKQNNRTAIVYTLAYMLTVELLAQSVPSLINYQGRLTDQSGAPFAPGSYGIQFRLWESATGQVPAGLIWAQQQNVALQANGVFNVILGAPGGTAIPGATPAVNDLAFAFASSNRYLELTVVSSNGFPLSAPSEIVPRLQLMSVPFAVMSQQVANGAIGSQQIANGSIEDRHIGVLSRLSASDGSPTNAVVVDATGRVGIGTNNPQATLDVAGLLKIGGMAQQSLGPNGYIQIGELIVQWGQDAAFGDIANFGPASTTTHTFRIPFPNEVFVVVPGMIVSQTQDYACAIAVQSFSKTSVTLLWHEWAGHVQSIKSTYIAIGR